MNKNFIIFGLMILLSSFVSATTWNRVFYDDFSSGSYTPTWYTTSGTWSVASGQMCLSSATTDSYISTSNFSFNSSLKYNISFDLDLPNADAYGILHFYQNTSTKQYYLYIHNVLAQGLFKENGTSTKLISLPVDDKALHTHNIVWNGSIWQYYKDGSINSTNSAEGTIQAYTGNNLSLNIYQVSGVGCFDNIAIYEYVEPIFELTAKNVYDSSAISNFTAQITNATTTQTITTTNGSIPWTVNELINVTIYNMTGFFNQTYTNWNTSNVLDVKTYQSLLYVYANDSLNQTIISNFNTSVNGTYPSFNISTIATNKTTHYLNSGIYNITSKAERFSANKSALISLSSYEIASLILNFTLGNVNIYGPFNSSVSFNRVLITSDCSSASAINISRNSSSFVALNDGYNHTFDKYGLGFFLRIDSDACSWITLTKTILTYEIDYEILLENSLQNKTYEFGSIANITLLTNNTDLTYCINYSISKYGNDYICNTTNMSFSQPIDFLEFTEFNSGNTSLNINFTESNETLRIFTDGYSLNDNLNLYFLGGTTISNFLVSINGIIQLMTIGNIIGDKETITTDSLGLSNKTIVFPTAGIQTMTFNYSSNGNMLSTDTCSFKASGFSSNPESFRYYEGFINSSKISSYDNTLPYSWRFDNFTNPATESDWTESTSQTAGDAVCYGSPQSFYYSNSLYQSTQTTTCPLYGRDCSDAGRSKEVSATTYYSDALDFSEYDHINITFNQSNYAYCFAGTGCIDIITSGAISTYTISLRDNTGTLQTLNTQTNSVSCTSGQILSSSSSAMKSIVLNRTENISNYAVYVDGVYSSTIIIDSLKTYSVSAYGYSFVRLAKYGGSDAVTTLRLHSIDFGGIGLEHTGDPLTSYYAESSYFTTPSLHTFAQNYSGFYFEVEDYVPSGSSIDYYASNNNGSTWFSIDANDFAIVPLQNSTLLIRANITKGSATDIMPHIRSYTVDVSDVFVENLSVDVGGDGTYEFNLSGNLTGTNSPQNITFACSDLESEIEEYCNPATDLICENVPINFRSTSIGIMNVYDINITKDFTNLIFDTSDYSGKDWLNLTFSADSGSATIYNISQPYIGDGNFTISLYSLLGEDIATALLNVRHSDWNYSYPNNVDYFEFLPKKSTSLNVTPYKQTNSVPILNITTLNKVDNMNFSIHLNETYSCVNLTVSNSNNKSAGTQLTNGTWTTLFTNKSENYNSGLWFWADYACSNTNWYLWYPELSFRGCCVECVCSESVE